jgi:hypothetical protein
MVVKGLNIVRMIFHMGGKSTSSAKKLEAVNAGRSYNFGVTTEIQCVKITLMVLN